MSDAAARLPSQNVGAAGEHYVAMQLNRHGVDTAMLTAGNPVSDLLAHLDGATASIQVKTSSKSAERPVDLFMHAAKVTQPDFLIVVMLTPVPVAFVLPRAVTIEWCAQFNDGHANAPVTRMNVRSRQYLQPYGESWHLVVQHLAAAASRPAAA